MARGLAEWGGDGNPGGGRHPSLEGRVRKHHLASGLEFDGSGGGGGMRGGGASRQAPALRPAINQ